MQHAGLQEKKRINKEGELVVTSTLTRSQACVMISWQPWHCARMHRRSAHRSRAYELQAWDCVGCSRDNVEDALEKLQACIDNAAETLIPAEVDPEKQKQIAKQCAHALLHAWAAAAGRG